MCVNAHTHIHTHTCIYAFIFKATFSGCKRSKTAAPKAKKKYLKKNTNKQHFQAANEARRQRPKQIKIKQKYITKKMFRRNIFRLQTQQNGSAKREPKGKSEKSGDSNKAQILESTLYSDFIQ
jgi:hypothetical protein